MSDSNRIRVSIVEESTYGTIPTSPAWLVVETTGQSMSDDVSYQESQTIDANRNVRDLVRLSLQAGGGVPMEFRYSPSGEGLAAMIEALFASTWFTTTSISTASTFNSGNIITRASGTWAGDGYEVGDYVLVDDGTTVQAALIASFNSTTSMNVTTTVALTDNAGSATVTLYKDDVYTASSGTATLVDSVVTFTAADGLQAGLKVGDVVKLSSATAPQVIDGYYPVTAVTETTVTVQAPGLALAAASDVALTRASRLRNGTTERSFSIEIARLDLQTAQVFSGCVIDTLTLRVADEAITTCNFGVVGATSTIYTSNNGTTDQFGTGSTYTDPSDAPILDSLSVPEVRRGGEAYAAKSIEITHSNGAQPRTQIGALGPQSVRYGTFRASGSIQAYFEDYSDLTDYRDNQSTDVWVAMIDTNDRGFTVSWPRIKFSRAAADTQGPDQDDMTQADVTAYEAASGGYSAQIQRWD